VAAGAACLLADRLNPWELGDANQGSLFVFAFLLVWMGAFALFFGTRAFSAARFPLLFLLFAVPIPQPLLSRIIYFLQERSADIAEQFFRLGGVPYFRQGLIFQLPGVAIRVAEECSGIRSSMALFITTVLAAYLFLNTTWRKVVLCLVVVPLAIVKNGLRIMVLTTLAIYVDPSFLRGNLHHHGGVVFFLIALVPLGLLLVWFQKSEKVISSRFAASQSA
jgi:exosortase